MPRIEIIPAHWAEEHPREPTPTIDVCRSCGKDFSEGGAFCSGVLLLDQQYPEATVGSVAVDHPSYEDDDYQCEICDEELTDVDA